MKRTLVFLLVASMLSTCTGYAADGSEAIYGESEYAEAYSQSGSEGDSYESGSEDDSYEDLGTRYR